MKFALLKGGVHVRTFSASGTLFAWRATAFDPPTAALLTLGALQDSQCMSDPLSMYAVAVKAPHSIPLSLHLLIQGVMDYS